MALEKSGIYPRIDIMENEILYLKLISWRKLFYN